MSVVVDKISKLFGEQKALDEVSFGIKSGQIVGFLGPNGAGKSTMMKILTCFIPPSSGKATVNGFDVLENALEVRRLVGYLPEHNPLYTEMYVKEYLEFVAGIFKLPQKTKRVEEMIELTGLKVEQKKKIGMLSKGYRQRVGLAQALIHHPQVLILDEPTTGLDPNQIVEIRNLIREIGQNKTIMLSTHIMQEVEAICDRVIIINNGRIVADEETNKLQHFGIGKEILIVEFSKSVDSNKIKSLNQVEKAIETGLNTWQITCPANVDIRPAIFNLAVDEEVTVLTMQKQTNSLEQVFRELTK
ncbi:MAG TPA: gliding motility-associated ABC transporter ATP-binding subunit GldA [Bacteroidales bacterium]|nr:gliding motility-associated ABC transporter ATP-binding subunit GldA [Bacteroidales bacterium]HPR56888.1 gliding motility-associated ABC transporter ATP-binding subunit GldA [Bacteroidales bacterium]HRW96066.1 gliding motility-associated ABC transporter ATP-binding subunit GldA [Bacteroidales bacterium]